MGNQIDQIILSELIDLRDTLEDKYDYATDTGEYPWGGAGGHITALNLVIERMKGNQV